MPHCSFECFRAARAGKETKEAHIPHQQLTLPGIFLYLGHRTCFRPTLRTKPPPQLACVAIHIGIYPSDQGNVVLCLIHPWISKIRRGEHARAHFEQDLVKAHDAMVCRTKPRYPA